MAVQSSAWGQFKIILCLGWGGERTVGFQRLLGRSQQLML